MGKKICVVFPGIGYHTDKPVLYYSKKYMIAHGYDIVDVTYGKLSGHLPEEIQKVFDDGWNKAVDCLKNVDFSDAEDIVFLSKSIGTAISARYVAEKGLKVRNIYFTPLEITMQYANSNGIAFHGTADPLVNTGELTRLCEAKNIPLYKYEGGNHSIETEGQLYIAEIAVLITLLIGTAVYILLLRVLPDTSWLEGCQIRRFTGVICPACGTTRAVLAMLHGHLLTALYYHVATVYLACICIIYLVGNTIRLATNGRAPLVRFRLWYVYVWLGIFVVSYVVKLVVPGYVI